MQTLVENLAVSTIAGKPPGAYRVPHGGIRHFIPSKARYW